MSISATKYTALALLFSLSACEVGPDFLRPESPKAGSYNAGGDPAKAGAEQHFAMNKELPSDWWKLFSSDDLNKQVADALAGSPTLEAAEATLRVAQDNLRAGQGVFFPQANAGGDATREKFLPAQIGENAQGKIFNLYTLSGTVSYTLDIFGGERRQVESLGAQADVQRANVQAAYLTLSSNVVNTVIARAAYNAEIDDLQKLIDAEKEELRYTEIQYKAGTIPYSNVLSLQTQLTASEAALPPVKQSLTQAENLLAQLSGKTPAEGIPAAVALSSLTLPAELPVTLPSELAHKRPDILAAEAQLHSASAQIGVATAALFPNITLSGDYGVGSAVPAKIFSGMGGFWDLGSQIVAPVFHGGTLLAQREAAKDTYVAAGANYKQTVLAAFAQVANSLRALEHDAELVKAQSEARATAEKNLHLTQDNYEAGLVGDTQVLIANAQYLQADSGYIQATAQRLQDTVALFVTLGGAWQGSDPKK